MAEFEQRRLARSNATPKGEIMKTTRRQRESAWQDYWQHLRDRESEKVSGLAVMETKGDDARKALRPKLVRLSWMMSSDGQIQPREGDQVNRSCNY